MTTFAPPPLHQDPWNPEVDGMPMPHMEVLSPADLARQIQNIAGQLPRSEARDSIADLPGLVGQTRMRYENVLADRAVQCIREVTHDGITGEVLDADVNDAFRDAAAEATGVVSDYEQDLIDRLTEHYGTGPSHEVDRHTHARSLATRAVRGKVATAVARQAEAACKSTRVELAPPVVRRAGEVPGAEGQLHALAADVLAVSLIEHVDALQAAVDTPEQRRMIRLVRPIGPEKEYAIIDAANDLRTFLARAPHFSDGVERVVVEILEEANMLPVQGDARAAIIQAGVAKFKAQVDVDAAKARVRSSADQQLFAVFSSKYADVTPLEADAHPEPPAEATTTPEASPQTDIPASYRRLSDGVRAARAARPAHPQPEVPAPPATSPEDQAARARAIKLAMLSGDDDTFEGDMDRAGRLMRETLDLAEAAGVPLQEERERLPALWEIDEEERKNLVTADDLAARGISLGALNGLDRVTEIAQPLDPKKNSSQRLSD